MTQEFNNAASCWKAILSDVEKNRDLLTVIEKFARENTAPSEIVFGTSGWRGEIGTDYTFNNVRIVTLAIIEMFKSNDPQVMTAMGVADFQEIQSRGVIVGHDNRFLGADFAREAISLLMKEGVESGEMRFEQTEKRKGIILCRDLRRPAGHPINLLLYRCGEDGPGTDLPRQRR